MNKIILIGNLARDPELISTLNGISVCNITLAVNREYSDEAGNKVADFFNIKVWREKAQNCAKYLKKGNKVAVVGSLQNRAYEDQYGTLRHVAEIMAQSVEFLSYNGNDESADESAEQPAQEEAGSEPPADAEAKPEDSRSKTSKKTKK